jgi:hypothetical protein
LKFNENDKNNAPEGFNKKKFQSISGGNRISLTDSEMNFL